MLRHISGQDLAPSLTCDKVLTKQNTTPCCQPAAASCVVSSVPSSSISSSPSSPKLSSPSSCMSSSSSSSSTPIVLAATLRVEMLKSRNYTWGLNLDLKLHWTWNLPVHKDSRRTIHNGCYAIAGNSDCLSPTRAYGVHLITYHPTSGVRSAMFMFWFYGDRGHRLSRCMTHCASQSAQTRVLDLMRIVTM